MDKCRDTAFASYACPMERNDCTTDGVCFCESESFGAVTLLLMATLLLTTVGVCCFFLRMERKSFEEAGASILLNGRAAKYGTVDNESLPVRASVPLPSLPPRVPRRQPSPRRAPPSPIAPNGFLLRGNEAELWAPGIG